MRYSIVAIGRFLSVRRWVKQRMAQICLTTAELALHYGGLGAGSPTSEVQEVKRLHCLPMQIVLLLPCLLQWFQTSSVPANRAFLLPAPQPRWQSRQNAPEFGSPHSFASSVFLYVSPYSKAPLSNPFRVRRSIIVDFFTEP